MSVYKRYIEECTDKKLLETDKGFALYSYPNEKTVYIEEISVLPEFRKAGAASEMANTIALEAKGLGCTTMLGSVNTKIKDPTTSMIVLIRYGMTFLFSTPEIIYFKKDL